ncbi:MAG: proton-conducting transporter membrane subunit [Elusimicrobiota bacterium]
MIFIFVIIPILTAILLTLFNKLDRRWLGVVTSAALGVNLVAAFILISKLAGNGFQPVVYKLGGWTVPMGILLVADGLTAFMLVLINLISMICAVYSIKYMDKFLDEWKYFVLFLMLTASFNGAVLSGDIFNMFVFIEMGTISAAALIAFDTAPEELESAFRYMIFGSAAALFVMLGIALTYAYTSTLNMADVAVSIVLNKNVALISFITVLFIIGFFTKSAVVPFHFWLPDAHSSAPSPVSAMLSGILVKVLGLYALTRIIFNVLGADVSAVLMAFGVVSMIVGGLLAVYQKDIKRLLAYSTISQVGYILFAFGLNTQLGFFAGLFHMFNHAVAKSLMFLTSGAVMYATDERILDNFGGGLRKKMPLTSITSFIGSMSISGLPPLGGFWSKLLIVIAAVQSGKYGYALIAVVVSIITLSYFIKWHKEIFFGELPEKWSNIKESPLVMLLPMIILALLCAVSGFLLLPGISSNFLEPAAKVLSGGVEYGKTVLELAK